MVSHAMVFMIAATTLTSLIAINMFLKQAVALIQATTVQMMNMTVLTGSAYQ